MQKILAKELGRDNIRLSTRFCGIFSIYEFDMGNPGLYVMNAGCKAMEWFGSLFCSEIEDEDFFTDFIPRAIDSWLNRESTVTYVPYLTGSRYSQEPLKAEFLG